MNYLLPEIFQDSSLFDTAADISDDTLNRDTCEKARALLDECFMIRREKKDVETSLPPKIFCKLFVHMTPLQRKWYRSILSINDPCNLDTSVRGDVSLLSNTQLQHILSQLQKVVNHPKQILIKRESDRHAENSRVMNAAYSGSEFIKPRGKKEYTEARRQLYMVNVVVWVQRTSLPQTGIRRRGQRKKSCEASAASDW